MRHNSRRCSYAPFAALGFGLALLLGAMLAVGVATPPAYAAPEIAACNDSDGDGYGSPGDGDCPNGAATDCNDGDVDIFPGASESCNSADDDCDGAIDEGFVLSRESTGSSDSDCKDGADNDGDGFTDAADPQCAASFVACIFSDPPACSPGDAGGCCQTAGISVCEADGSASECILDGTQLLQEAEPPAAASDAECFDAKDNDCDALTDHDEPSCQTSELCDGFDNDNDGLIDETFTNLGDPCNVGTGICAKTGIFACSLDQLSAVCNASAGVPGVEGPAGGGKCSDLKDNDCDGTTDLADTSCQSEEICDGLDNDGDGPIDETFTDLGDACSAGIGACLQNGVRVCKADGTATVCGAVAAPEATEGPSGPTCTDGIDNDCDDTTDLLDADCGSSLLSVSCALPYVRGGSGGDCTGSEHTIQFDVENESLDAVVKAELLAVGLDGSVLQVQPVGNNQPVHLASRIDPANFKMITKLNKKGPRHEVFAPIPMLRITVTDGPATATAYCSNIPFLDVVKPAGGVVSASEGSLTKVLAALPRIDPATLFIKVDGVDLLDAMGIDPAVDLPGGPFNDTVVINGASVDVIDLIVDIGGLDELSSNSVSFGLDGLGCGGHIIVIEGTPQVGARRDPESVQCALDDLKDKGFSMVFAVEVTNPTPGQITNVVPTPVEGTVCHGQAIASLHVNGKDVPVGGQVLTPGDGEDSADTVTLDFSTSLGQTDLVAEVEATNASFDTFDAGSNRLYAAAADEAGNRTYDTFTFAVGQVAQAGVLPPEAQAELAGVFDATARQAIMEHFQALAGTTITDAFVLGLKKEALLPFFEKTIQDADDDAKAAIDEALRNHAFPSKEAEVDAACNPTVKTKVTNVQFNGDFTVTLDLAPDLLTLTIFAPELIVDTNSYGYCCDGCDFICISEVIIDIDARFTIPKPGAQPIRFAFPVDEGTFLTGGEIDGQFIRPTEVAEPEILNNRIEINCFSAVANFFIALGKLVVNFFVTVFTFGLVDAPFDLSPSMEGVADAADIQQELQISTFPVAIKGIKPSEEAVAETGKVLTADPVDAQFTASGITVVLDGTFSSTSTDPDIDETPGSVLTPAPVPAPPQPGSLNTYLVASDDVLNQMFAAMTTQGELKTICKPSGKTVNDFLPADCNSITAANELLTAGLQGACQGIKGADCATLTDTTLLLTATRRGGCFGATQEHSICASFGPVQAAACDLAPFLNLEASMPFLFCGQADIPPRLLIHDDGATDGIETDLRFNDLVVGVILDRDGDGIDAELTSLGTCTGEGFSITGDCKLGAACIDLNYASTLTLTTEDGKLRMRPTLGDLTVPPRDPGALCAGGLPVITDDSAIGSALNGPSVDDIRDNANGLTPPIQTDGVTLGNFVSFINPKLIALETDGDLSFQDYVGVTGDIAPAP